MKFEKIYIVAPTRSTCLNISLALSMEAPIETLLWKEKSTEIQEAVENLRITGKGFGIVAATGTGKTLSIREIAKLVLDAELCVDIITREHQATDFTQGCNIIVVTPGVILNWLKNGTFVKHNDLILVDEIHQTSEHLELSLALAKRNHNPFVWMSATVDPQVYADYLESSTVISCGTIDPAKKSVVTCHPLSCEQFIDRNIRTFVKEKRGVAVFVPSRKVAEELSRKYASEGGISSEFYHGGESVDKLRQYLSGNIPKPFMIFMTNAGSSSLNIVGLDTVVIFDEIYRTISCAGAVVLGNTELQANDLLQMGGRVNGRAENSQIHILTRRLINYDELRPSTPIFELAGLLDRLVLICARLGVNVSKLNLLSAVDPDNYNACVHRFIKRGLIRSEGKLLTDYGSRVEGVPVERAWGENIIHALRSNDTELLKVTVVCGCVQSLYALLVHGRKISPEVIVSESDHLTAYNIVVMSLQQFGSLDRERDDTEPRYGFLGDTYYADRSFKQPRMYKGEFIEWCTIMGFNPNAIREVAIAMRSVFRQLEMDLPEPETFNLIIANSDEHRAFLNLLASVQSMEFVRDSQNSSLGKVWPNRNSLTKGRRVLGRIQLWNDRQQVQRATIEGTEIPDVLIEAFLKKEVVDMGEQTSTGTEVIFAETFAGEQLGQSTSVLTQEELLEYLTGQRAGS